jgi:hypothetical protein
MVNTEDHARDRTGRRERLPSLGFLRTAITECGVCRTPRTAATQLCLMCEHQVAAVREVITKRRKTLLSVCKLLCWERSAFGQQLAITALSGLVSQNVDALLEGRAFEGKDRDTSTRCSSTAHDCFGLL